jgi:hypothetical protein
MTSLEDVLVVSYNGYFLFGYGNRGVIAIKRRVKKLFSSGKPTYINDGYTIKGVSGFSNLICPMISLTPKEFNVVMMEWIVNKHPEIDNVIKLYEFCMVNHKRYNDIKHLLE